MPRKEAWGGFYSVWEKFHIVDKLKSWRREKEKRREIVIPFGSELENISMVGLVTLWLQGKSENPSVPGKACLGVSGQYPEEEETGKRERMGLGRELSGYEHWLFLQQTWVHFPVCTWWFTMTCNSSSKGSNALFWTSQAPGTWVEHRYTYKHPFT